jgi:hypothetical protein
MDGLFRFLGVESIEVKPRRKNTTKLPVSLTVQRFLQHHMLNTPLYKPLTYLNRALGSTGYPEMEQDLKERLYLQFEKDNIELGKLIGKDLKKYWSK